MEMEICNQISSGNIHNKQNANGPWDRLFHSTPRWFIVSAIL
jgi:hypothetical protein